MKRVNDSWVRIQKKNERVQVVVNFETARKIVDEFCFLHIESIWIKALVKRIERKLEQVEHVHE